MSSEIYDLIVVGGGPAGYTGAIVAGRMGKKVLLIERERLGGTCLNVGCIPTKYLLDKAGELEKIRHMTKQGIFRDAGSFNFAKIQAGKAVVVNKLVSGVDSLLKNAKVTVIRGKAVVRSNSQVECNGQIHTTKHILLATGSSPAQPPIPGAAEHTIGSTEALDLESVPASLAVVGGGVIGLEIASAFHSFGSKVIVLEMLDQIMPGEDADSIREMVRSLSAKGIVIRTGVRVKQIQSSGSTKVIEFSNKEQTFQVSVDQVLLAAGRKPNFEGIDVTALGIALDAKGFVIVDEHMKAGSGNVYAAGDVAGGWQLAHSAYIEAEVAVHNMFGDAKAIDQSIMPRCIYTIPPYAAVGLNKQQAEKTGRAVSVGIFHYSANGMALAEDASEGTARVVVEQTTGRVIGAQIVGIAAPELIATATMAIRTGVTVDQWQDIITAHPSVSEILREAALESQGKSIHSMVKTNLV